MAFMLQDTDVVLMIEDKLCRLLNIRLTWSYQGKHKRYFLTSYKNGRRQIKIYTSQWGKWSNDLYLYCRHFFSLGRHKLLRRMFCYPDSPVLHYIKTQLMRKCLWRKQWHQPCKHRTLGTFSFFGPDDKMFSTGFNLSQIIKKKHWLYKGQKHLEIIL